MDYFYGIISYTTVLVFCLYMVDYAKARKSKHRKTLLWVWLGMLILTSGIEFFSSAASSKVSLNNVINFLIFEGLAASAFGLPTLLIARTIVKRRGKSPEALTDLRPLSPVVGILVIVFVVSAITIFLALFSGTETVNVTSGY